jgi:hypothetical protein
MYGRRREGELINSPFLFLPAALPRPAARKGSYQPSLFIVARQRRPADFNSCDRRTQEKRHEFVN